MSLIKSNSRRSGEMNAPELPERVIRLLTNAPYAHLVARSESDRVLMLPNVVSLHTKDELSRIHGLGPIAIRTVEKWLAHYGRRLRRPSESLDTIICGFSFQTKKAQRPSRPQSQREVYHHDIGTARLAFGF